MPIFDQFDLIRIVNLPHRVNRREEMDRELSGLGLAGDPRVVYFNAVRPDDKGDFTTIGARGIFASQLALLRDAASADRPILILEDDCQFRSDAAAYRTTGDWDIFYGGYYAATPDDLFHSDIIGAHMMGFTGECAGRVVEYLDNLRCEGIHPPMDAAYVWYRRAFPDVATEFVVPPLAIQRSSRSDIAQPKPWDKIPGINAVRRIRNSLARF